MNDVSTGSCFCCYLPRHQASASNQRKNPPPGKIPTHVSARRPTHSIRTYCSEWRATSAYGFGLTGPAFMDTEGCSAKLCRTAFRQCERNSSCDCLSYCSELVPHLDRSSQQQQCLCNPAGAALADLAAEQVHCRFAFGFLLL